MKARILNIQLMKKVDCVQDDPVTRPALSSRLLCLRSSSSHPVAGRQRPGARAPGSSRDSPGPAL